MNTRPHDIRPGGRPAAGLAAGLAAVAVTLAAGLSAAAAADTWTTPHPGVKHLARTTGRPWRINALVVDLCAAGVSLRATAEADRWRTVGSFADRVNAEAAVNGDFFSYETHLPTGLAISGGDVWHADMAGSGEILFGDDRAFLNAPGAVADPPVWAREAVSGRPLLVDGGAPLEAFNRGDCVDRHPRTAIGLSEDRRTLFLAVVDGRSNASIGMNCAELADLMDGLGAHRAMNLDGGGSSTMYVAGRGVVNDPSDGNQRTVANHLGIQASGRGAPDPARSIWPRSSQQALPDGLARQQRRERRRPGGRVRAGLERPALRALRLATRFWAMSWLAAVGRRRRLRRGEPLRDAPHGRRRRATGGRTCARAPPSGLRLLGLDPGRADSPPAGRPATGATTRLAQPQVLQHDSPGGRRRGRAGWTSVRARPATSGAIRRRRGGGYRLRGRGRGPDPLGRRPAGAIRTTSARFAWATSTPTAERTCARGQRGLCGAGATGRRLRGRGRSRARRSPTTPDIGDVGYWSTIRLEDIDADGRADLPARA
jgi:hypothetical protein